MGTKGKIIIIIFVLVLSIILVFSQKDKNGNATPKDVVTIGIAVNPYIQDISTNYYKEWLEEETGLKLQFILIPQEYTAEYLDQMFHSGNIPMDALFSFPCEDDTTSVNSTLQEYGSKGYILPLNKYIDNSPIMQKIFNDFSEYNLKKVMTAPDGNLYYIPGLDSSIEEKCPQIMWINQSWLKALGLPIPVTLEEFKATLKAFQTGDPNGNGQKDEIPLAGSTDSISEQSYDFIINSFVYNDPENCRMMVQNGTASFAPLTPEWREAIQYLYNLYQENLLDPFQFTLNHQQFVQLANDPRNLLGAFTSSGITDVLLARSPEIMSRYVRVTPLTGANGISYVTVKTPLPKPNGIITSTCKNPDAVFRVFELMLSKEAFLIGRYGQQGVDWQYANAGDIDNLGNPAIIRIRNQLQKKAQNKNLLELGPFFAYTEYTNGIAWNGIESEQEYINARAYDLYRSYRPPEYIKTIIFEGDDSSHLTEVQRNIDTYTNTNLEKFIQGKLDPYNDTQWNQYIAQYKNLGIGELTLAVQNSYDSLLKK